MTRSRLFIMQKITRSLYHLVLGGLCLVLSSCAATSINKNHDLYVTDPDLAAANLYFIRPFTYRDRGLADNPVHIEINGKELLSLGKGEYTFIRVKPVKVSLITRSLTQFTNGIDPIEITRTSEIELLPGQTYYLHVRQVNEEFRGVYYLVEQVDLQQAKQLAEGLRSTNVPGSLSLDKL